MNFTEERLPANSWAAERHYFSTCKIVLNGTDRISERKASYFKYCQRYQSGMRQPSDGGAADGNGSQIYVYSFALKPLEHQPSGTCNFSRIDSAQLHLTFKNNPHSSARVFVYAVNYNILRIMSGMGGLAYSN